MRSQFVPNAPATICDLTAEQIRDLFWVAFLFTGDQKTSEDALLRALTADSEDTENSLTGEWRDALRAALLSEVLCTLYPQLAVSRRRTEMLLLQNHLQVATLPDSDWSGERQVKPEDFKRTVLGIDVFPRCVLLLTIFEKFSLDQVGRMLEATTKLTAAAQSIALTQLTRGIALCQGWREGLRDAPLLPLPLATAVAAH